MPALPPNPPLTHIDQDTDDVFQARGNIETLALAVHAINNYLNDLFGALGTKSQAISVLFSGQAVLFAPGTIMPFVQATAPLGWTKLILDADRYLFATSGGTGGQAYGNFNAILPSTHTAITHAQLPAVTISGVTDWQGQHAHNYTRTWVSSREEQSVSPVMSPQATSGARIFMWYNNWNTDGAGNHYHTISLPLGGSNHGHQHHVDLSAYRPAAFQCILARKD